MREISRLLANNRLWAAHMTTDEAAFFQQLAAQQTPAYLWIGCSDSRVPSAQLVGLLPGEMFVHRNLANLVAPSDLNCLAVLQYGVDILKVRHVIVCGHYDCSAVEAVLHNRTVGLVDTWLRPIKEVCARHAALLAACKDDAQRLRCLCELNVVEQVVSLCRTATVTGAWERGQELAVHGWIYGIADGLLRDIGMTLTGPGGLAATYAQALGRIA